MAPHLQAQGSALRAGTEQRAEVHAETDGPYNEALRMSDERRESESPMEGRATKLSAGRGHTEGD